MGSKVAGRSAGYRVVALVISVALFVQYLDSTILVVALPKMAGAFGVSPIAMTMILTTYLLSLAVFIPVSGAAADKWGARPVFCVALGLFTLTSLLCAQANDLILLSALRFVQGIGGAMMLPVARLILVKSVAKSDLVPALAWMLIPATIGPALGAPVGGWIVTYFSWRWIFYVNVPIGVLGVVLSLWLIPDIKKETGAPFDYPGFAIAGAMIATLIVGLELATHHIGGYFFVLSLLLCSAFLGLGYAAYARRHAAPILDLRLLRIRTFGMSVAAGSIARVVTGALGLLLPMAMQLGLGLSPLSAGTVSLFGAAGATASRVAASFILRRWGFRGVLTGCSFATAIAIACYALFSPSWPLLAIYAVVLVSGYLQSLQLLAYTSIAYAEIDQRQMAAATSFYTTLQQLTLSLGVCFAIYVLETIRVLAGHDRPFLSDFSASFLIVAFLLVFTGVIAWRLPGNAGAEIARRSQ